MAIERIFHGKVTDNKLRLVEREVFDKRLQLLNGREVEVILRPHRKTRSGPQNRYLHGCVIPLLADHLGYEVDEMKDALKFKFLRTHDDGPLPATRRTRDLDTAEFTIFVEQVRRLAAGLGCVIPDPSEVEFA